MYDLPQRTYCQSPQSTTIAKAENTPRNDTPLFPPLPCECSRTGSGSLAYVPRGGDGTPLGRPGCQHGRNLARERCEGKMQCSLPLLREYKTCDGSMLRRGSPKGFVRIWICCWISGSSYVMTLRVISPSHVYCRWPGGAFRYGGPTMRWQRRGEVAQRAVGWPLSW